MRAVDVEATAGRAGRSPLTTRERDVLALVSRGEPASEVAVILGLPLTVVATCLVEVRRKYGVASTRAALDRAHEEGAV